MTQRTKLHSDSLWVNGRKMKHKAFQPRSIPHIFSGCFSANQTCQNHRKKVRFPKDRHFNRCQKQQLQTFLFSTTIQRKDIYNSQMSMNNIFQINKTWATRASEENMSLRPSTASLFSGRIWVQNNILRTNLTPKIVSMFRNLENMKKCEKYEKMVGLV